MNIDNKMPISESPIEDPIKTLPSEAQAAEGVLQEKKSFDTHFEKLGIKVLTQKEKAELSWGDAVKYTNEAGDKIRTDESIPDIIKVKMLMIINGGIQGPGDLAGLKKQFGVSEKN